MNRFACHVAKLALVTASGTLLCGCSEEAGTPLPPRPVLAARVEELSVLEGRWLPGRAQAAAAVNLSFRIGGPLVDRPVDVGSVVREGDLLARIDPRDYEVRVRDIQGQLERARAELTAMETGARPEDVEILRASVERSKASLRLAEFEYQKIQKLEEQGSTSEQEVEQYLASREAAKAELRTAEENLLIGERGARKEDIEAKKGQITSIEAAFQAVQDALADCNLRAPIDGTVTEVFVENHEIVQPQQSIVRLINDTSIEITINVPEASISLVDRVTEITCRFDAFEGRTFPGTIKEVGLEASTTTRTYPVTIAVEQPEGVRILPGMAGAVTGKLTIDESETGGVIVPVGAVVPDSEDGAFVWVIEGAADPEAIGTAHRRHVRQREVARYGIRVEGLERGTWVATAGVNTISEGQRVRILDATSMTPGKP